VKQNVFIMGLNEFNLRLLSGIPGAEGYQFHGLLRPEDVLETYDFPIADMLRRAEEQLNDFSGGGKRIDAIAGYMDFPVSTMLPILCEKFGTITPSLEALLKCEHKYWSRLEQKKVIAEHIPEFRIFDPFDEEALAQIDIPYPFWVKPIKSSGSFLGFRVEREEDFHAATAEIRKQIELIAEPFAHILSYVELPPEVARVPAHACLAEGIIGGRQCTLEGYSHRGRVEVIGIVDSIRYENMVSFFRYEYPSSLPDVVQERMAEITRRIIPALGYDNAAFNIEYFWDRERDAVWLLEINTRVSQSHSDLFEKVDGASNQAVTVKTALGEDPAFPQRKGEFFCAAKFFWRLFHLEDGLVRRVPTPEEIARVQREVPGTFVRPQVHEGMRLSELLEQDSYSYAICYLYIGAQSRKELLDAYMYCQEHLPFEIEPIEA
jgi:biotin carboxylase